MSCTQLTVKTIWDAPFFFSQSLQKVVGLPPVGSVWYLHHRGYPKAWRHELPGFRQNSLFSVVRCQHLPQISKILLQSVQYCQEPCSLASMAWRNLICLSRVVGTIWEALSYLRYLHSALQLDTECKGSGAVLEQNEVRDYTPSTSSWLCLGSWIPYPRYSVWVWVSDMSFQKVSTMCHCRESWDTSQARQQLS